MTVDTDVSIGRICIVDDEPSICKTLSGILSDEGHKVFTADSAASGLKLISKINPEICFLDVWLQDGDGVELLERIRIQNPDCSVIMMSGHSNIETAVKCTKLGAVDFIEKPLSLDKILVTTLNALKLRNLKLENQHLKKRFSDKNKLIGTSKALETIRSIINTVSSKNSTVLITGENGTGKENVARAIHEASLRSKRPFIAINCAAIPDDLIESEMFGHEKGAFTGASSLKRGRFELANCGTLFLDEIGDMSLRTQSKLLRVLQELKFERVGGDDSISVDVRIIAATNKKLPEEIKLGTFREDLFYRLNVIPIELPPLRERVEDIAPISEHFIDFYSLENSVKKKSFSPDAIEALKAYQWPGNIRELKNIAERLSIMTDNETIFASDLPYPIGLPAGKDLAPDFMANHNFKEAKSDFERAFLMTKLELFNHNISRTAEGIGMERSHLYRKMKQLNIDTKDE